MSKKNLEDGKIEKEENSLSCHYLEACERILWGTSINDKIAVVANISWENSEITRSYSKDICDEPPGRPKNLYFSQEKIKFPKDHEFNVSANRAKALHFFANHELLAIEVMAKMILLLPNGEKYLPVKKDIWKTLQDEQKHLMLYKNRLEELGYTLGDFPVNDYFWKIFNGVHSFESYFSTMALTFESANLDFAVFYSKLFSQHGDFASSQLMWQVYQDEIHHVRLGFNYLSQLGPKENIWSQYVDSLPWPITPARAKGIQYQEKHRRESGMSMEFIKQLTAYKDGFVVTERKR
jgi:uncharacterized ferritin-like protein (DUF455 family)